MNYQNGKPATWNAGSVRELLRDIEGDLKAIKDFGEFEDDRPHLLGQIATIRLILGIEGEAERLPTLGEYLRDNASGAYHRFRFDIMNRAVEVMDVADFVSVYDKGLLDAYLVMKDESEDNGGNCENYLCVHRLTLVRKGEIDNER